MASCNFGFNAMIEQLKLLPTDIISANVNG